MCVWILLRANLKYKGEKIFKWSKNNHHKLKEITITQQTTEQAGQCFRESVLLHWTASILKNETTTCKASELQLSEEQEREAPETAVLLLRLTANCILLLSNSHADFRHAHSHICRSSGAHHPDEVTEVKMANTSTVGHSMEHNSTHTRVTFREDHHLPCCHSPADPSSSLPYGTLSLFWH